MNIFILPSGIYSTNAYIVSCLSTREAVIIDAPPESCEKILAYLKEQNLIPKAIWLTHSHWDHISDVDSLKASLNIPVYVHELDAANLIKPGADGLRLRQKIEGVAPDGFFTGNQHISVGRLVFQVIHTPGHSKGSICFFEPTTPALFSGDTLFKGTIGNLSFPTSEPKLIGQSLGKLAQLPLKTQVYPGHGPMTSIEDEQEMLHEMIEDSKFIL